MPSPVLHQKIIKRKRQIVSFVFLSWINHSLPFHHIFTYKQQEMQSFVLFNLNRINETKLKTFLLALFEVKNILTCHRTFKSDFDRRNSLNQTVVIRNKNKKGLNALSQAKYTVHVFLFSAQL
jgi:hypothetical protein